jgi:hypothetical protein
VVGKNSYSQATPATLRRKRRPDMPPACSSPARAVHGQSLSDRQRAFALTRMWHRQPGPDRRYLSRSG